MAVSSLSLILPSLSPKTVSLAVAKLSPVSLSPSLALSLSAKSLSLSSSRLSFSAPSQTLSSRFVCNVALSEELEEDDVGDSGFSPDLKLFVGNLPFNVDSAQLQRRSHAVLDNVAKVLNAHPEISMVRVEGHTDSTGSDGYNMRLSQRRAESVVRYLVEEGEVSEDRLLAQGFGEAQPLVPNAKTKMALAQNRRVEFHLVEADAEEPGLEL